MTSLKVLLRLPKNRVSKFSLYPYQLPSLWYVGRATLCTSSAVIRNTLNRGNNQQELKQARYLLAPTFKLQNFNALNKCKRCWFGTKNPDQANKSDTKSAAVNEVELFGDGSNLSQFQKLKLMYKKYWYVLIPVHLITSTCWIVGFYYMIKSGVDVASIMTSLHISSTIIEKASNSQVGHWALAYLCFKVATPLRYAVTLGGTTAAIRYLGQAGLIKPVPTKNEFMRIYEEKIGKNSPNNSKNSSQKSKQSEEDDDESDKTSNKKQGK
ncbi:uncharacterized protein C18orf19 homolog A [Glossina fuscipes]|uniref:Uncharacterized protein C18orf19 homolog A n=2 Tax=Nemorhina TaxID=44051 RepID=A0A9C6DRR8_9MUSC|nr:uncharacterized protein C18orf19 homolog A [Glossina fuscipes]KAI9582052.1 hypothetical protein GQX74_011547 [Glossina fuscipes]